MYVELKQKQHVLLSLSVCIVPFLSMSLTTEQGPSVVRFSSRKSVGINRRANIGGTISRSSPTVPAPFPIFNDPRMPDNLGQRYAFLRIVSKELFCSRQCWRQSGGSSFPQHRWCSRTRVIKSRASALATPDGNLRSTFTIRRYVATPQSSACGNSLS
jgi:hypothetical protein